MQKTSELQARLEQANLEHHKAINKIQYEAYQAWVAAGGKERAALERRIKHSCKNDKYKTKNGLTIHKLRLAGVSVKVSHIRYTTFDDVAAPVPVPSFMRESFHFLPRGGATHIHLTTPDMDTSSVTSVCHPDDAFDYKMGVKLALDQFTQQEADDLLVGLDVTEGYEQREPVAA
jgi:hypothetical protein